LGAAIAWAAAQKRWQAAALQKGEPKMAAGLTRRYKRLEFEEKIYTAPGGGLDG
jgi:hypothetical protein